jgi:RNA polymerase sigma-70 factor (ECF subfamily)
VAEKTDEQIATEVQAGDGNAFGLLVDRYEGKLTRYARKFLFRDEAADLVQDAFLRAYENIRGFDARRRFSPWMYRIAHNVFMNALKRKRREPFHFFDADTIFPHPVAEERADSDAERRDIQQRIDAMLGSLPEKYREPLVLFYFEALNYDEIAEVLEIPKATVGVRLKRGREMLRTTHGDLQDYA